MHITTILALTTLISVQGSVAGSKAWMLSYEGKSTNSFRWDKRTESLINARVPAAFVCWNKMARFSFFDKAPPNGKAVNRAAALRL